MAAITSVTPVRFDGEPVAFPAVLPHLCDEIADRANGRGWCDCDDEARAAKLVELMALQLAAGQA
jgi:hypothetical protein